MERDFFDVKPQKSSTKADPKQAEKEKKPDEYEALADLQDPPPPPPAKSNEKVNNDKPDDNYEALGPNPPVINESKNKLGGKAKTPSSEPDNKAKGAKSCDNVAAGKVGSQNAVAAKGSDGQLNKNSEDKDKEPNVNKPVLLGSFRSRKKKKAGAGAVAPPSHEPTQTQKSIEVTAPDEFQEPPKDNKPNIPVFLINVNASAKSKKGVKGNTANNVGKSQAARRKLKAPQDDGFSTKGRNKVSPQNGNKPQLPPPAMESMKKGKRKNAGTESSTDSVNFDYPQPPRQPGGESNSETSPPSVKSSCVSVDVGRCTEIIEKSERASPANGTYVYTFLGVVLVSLVIALFWCFAFIVKENKNHD